MSVSLDGPLCFVVTRNHGSLIDTMIFLHGTGLLDRSVLLLPPELYRMHQNSLPVRGREYNSFKDLAQCIDAEQPVAVFLFSGYLLTSQQLLSPSQLKELLQLLEARGCLTLTNDPCWGLLSSRRVPMTSGLPSRTFLEKLRKTVVEWLIPHRLQQSYRIVRHLIHCYPVRVDGSLAAEKLKTVEFFNTGLMAFDQFGHATSAAASTWSRPIDRPYWLFILASLDYDIQANLHGKDAFITGLVAHLREANDAGRHAALIAPEECLAAVRQTAASPDLSLISFCDYQRYASLLMFAEYVFYWNIASSSSIYRLANRLPVFFFDQGHVSRWFQSFFDRTVELLYRGHRPIIQDHRQPLIPSRLEELARAYREHAEDIVRQLRQLPEPEEMVARLLRGAPNRAPTASGTP
jgi:hypothetical protein